MNPFVRSNAVNFVGVVLALWLGFFNLTRSRQRMLDWTIRDYLLAGLCGLMPAATSLALHDWTRTTPDRIFCHG